MCRQHTSKKSMNQRTNHTKIGKNLTGSENENKTHKNISGTAKAAFRAKCQSYKRRKISNE